jgi:tetratricopeptide (TPR) repeat protein
MRVLSHGIPFFCDETPLSLYDGPHDVRYMGNWEKAHYRYDPLAESAPEVIDRVARDWRADLILCWMPEVHPPPRRIEQAPIPTVALVSDWNVFYPLLRLNLARYDLVLCDKPGLRVLKNDWVTPRHLFPLYSQVTPVHRPCQFEKDIDVLFIGNLNHAAHAKRAHYLARLAKLSGRYRIVITSGAFGDAYAQLLSRARIVFNHSIRGELNLRLFETLACGSLAMIEEDNEEVRDWLTPGREVVLYNHENFEERLGYYLEHTDERETVAAAGHMRAPEFAGENRLNAIIDWAASQTPDGRRFDDLAPEERLLQDLLMYGFSRWPVYHRIEADLIRQVAAALPDDPRAWTAIGQHFVNPYSDAGGEARREERYLKAFIHAHRLDPDSAPYALNAASVFRACGMDGPEERYLLAARQASTLAGAEQVIGSPASAFRVRWQRCVAERTASTAIVHAEAAVRLAALYARNGALGPAEDLLREADQLDPDNAGGVRLLGELLWAKGSREEAVAVLRERLPNIAFDMDCRARLREMLNELGRTDEARAVAEESSRVTAACFDTPPLAGAL